MKQWIGGAVLALGAGVSEAQDLAVFAETVHTMSGTRLDDAVILVVDGKIVAVGATDTIEIPEGTKRVGAKVVTPGLIDAHSGIGFFDHRIGERDVPVGALCPERSARDAFSSGDPLLEWVRGFGVTTIHTGLAPGAVISGQTMIVKTGGEEAESRILVPSAMIAASLADAAVREGEAAPGTRSEAVALLRERLSAARGYRSRLAATDDPASVQRDPGLEALGRLFSGEASLLVTAHRARDILIAIRLAEEFKVRLVLDGAAESHLVLDAIRKAKVGVILHPTMLPARGETENLLVETAARLREAGIPVALQSGTEASEGGERAARRVVLFEAALAASRGMSFEDALALITIDAARILGIEKRVGSIEVGKDADFAFFDGDPFEYTAHCTGVVIDGEIVSREKR